MKMLLKPTALALAVALSIHSTGLHATGAVAGSTEYTQIASWAQNFQNFTSQITNLRQQLTTITDSLNVAKLMKEQLSSVTGLVRDVQGMRDTVQEMQNLRNEVQNAFGALDSIRDLGKQRFLEISRFKDQFGNRRSVEEYFVEAKRNNEREHQMNQVLRDQEVAAIKRLEQTGKSIQEHARKIPSTVGVHQAVSLMSTQINNLAAMTADINKITAVRAAKQTDDDDRGVAERQRALEYLKEQDRLADENNKRILNLLNR
jgi:hypothetical protein